MGWFFLWIARLSMATNIAKHNGRVFALCQRESVVRIDWLPSFCSLTKHVLPATTYGVLIRRVSRAVLGSHASHTIEPNMMVLDRDGNGPWMGMDFGWEWTLDYLITLGAVLGPRHCHLLQHRPRPLVNHHQSLRAIRCYTCG